MRGIDFVSISRIVRLPKGCECYRYSDIKSRSHFPSNAWFPINVLYWGGTSLDLLGLWGILWNSVGLCGTLWNSVELCVTLWNSMWTQRDSVGLCEDSVGLCVTLLDLVNTRLNT